MSNRRDWGEAGLADRIGDDDRLNYIKSMLGELQAMAKASDLVMLAYLIDMAHYEATDEIARRDGTAPKR